MTPQCTVSNKIRIKKIRFNAFITRRYLYPNPDNSFPSLLRKNVHQENRFTKVIIVTQCDILGTRRTVVQKTCNIITHNTD